MCTVADVRNDEVCQMETLQAECLDDHVIVVESAQLGRLKIGIHNFILVTTVCSGILKCLIIITVILKIVHKAHINTQNKNGIKYYKNIKNG